MAPKCYICNSYVPKTKSIFRIPQRHDEYCQRRNLWLKILDEVAENIDQIRICSEHFLKNKPAKKGDFLDIDWLPNQNLARFSKNFKYVENYFRENKATLPEEYLTRLQLNQNYQLPSNLRNNDNNSNLKQLNLNYQSQSYLSNNDNNFNSKQINQNYQSLEPNQNESNLSSNDNNFNSINKFSSRNVDVDVVSCEETLGNVTNVTNILVPLVQATADQTIPNSNTEKTTESVTALCQSFNLGLVIPPLKKRKIEIISEKFFLHKEIQTDLTSADIDALFLYYKNAVEERKELLYKISTLVIDVDFFKENDKKTRFYTGFTTWSLLNNFFALVKPYLPSHFNSKLSPFQILVMTLMKLRLNFNFTDLGYRFQVDRTTISKNFDRCIYILYKLFYNSKIIRWPERENIILNTPSYFRSVFKEKIIIIIDCFELFIERASVLRAVAQSFSSYRHHTTIKFLIGITTTGVIIFISDAFGGRASDKFITMKSALLDHLKEGDVVLADKGFLIEKEVEATGASLKMPAFVRNGNQLHPTEVEESRYVSSIRIHIERTIAVLRKKFNICSDIAPMSAVSKQNDLFNKDLYNIIVFICCGIINLCPPVVSNDFEI